MSTEFNVRDFGAKGDGVTDDTAAIQAATAAAARRTRPIHVCGYCREVCTGDGSDEHVCGNDDCLSIHLPAPEALSQYPQAAHPEAGGLSVRESLRMA